MSHTNTFVCSRRKVVRRRRIKDRSEIFRNCQKLSPAGSGVTERTGANKDPRLFLSDSAITGKYCSSVSFFPNPAEISPEGLLWSLQRGRAHCTLKRSRPAHVSAAVEQRVQLSPLSKYLSYKRRFAALKESLKCSLTAEERCSSVDLWFKETHLKRCFFYHGTDRLTILLNESHRSGDTLSSHLDIWRLRPWSYYENILVISLSFIEVSKVSKRWCVCTEDN